MIIVTTVEEEPATPPVVVDGPGRAVAPLRYEWRSWTGEVWDLTDPGGFVSKVKGATGLGFGPITHSWEDAAGIPGSGWGGQSDDRAEPFLPIEVRGRDSLHFLEVHGAFLRSLDPTREGVLAVTRPDGQTRTATVRYVSGADAVNDIDPIAACDVRYGITWAQPRPYWVGQRVQATYVQDDPPPFFTPPGGASVVHIARSDVLEDGTVDNPGDVPSWARWRIRGTVGSFEVGVGDSVLAMTVDQGAGDWIDVDMDPRVLTVVDQDGNDRLADATDVAFRAIPPGQRIDLTMSAAGAGAGFGIELGFDALYRSAWG